MGKKWKNLSLFIALMGTAVSAYAYGPYDGGYYGGYNGFNCSPDCCYPTDSTQWFVDAEFLYWEAQEDGLGYAKFTTGIPDPLTTVIAGPLVTRVVTPKTKWEPGFRVGLGVEGTCTPWYTSATYTYFRTDNKSHVIAPDIPGFSYELNTRSLRLTDPALGTLVDAFDADNKWRLSYNILDWEVGASYCVGGGKFVVTPFVGFRGAVITQKYTTDIDAIVTTAIPDTEAFIKDEVAKNNYHAFGIRTGLDFVWNMFGNFGVYAKGSASVLYGKFKIDDTFNETFSSLVTGGVISSFVNDAHYHLWRVRTNLEGAIGLQWTSQCKTFLIRAGYEISNWFDQNQLPSRILLTETSSGNLGLQGLQVRATYAF